MLIQDLSLLEVEEVSGGPAFIPVVWAGIKAGASAAAGSSALRAAAGVVAASVGVGYALQEESEQKR